MNSNVEKLLEAPQNLKNAFGEYFELYKSGLDGAVKMEVYSNPGLFGLSSRFHKDKTFGAEYGCGISNKFFLEWEKNTSFIDISTANERFTDDINLYPYIVSTPFTNTKACRILYDKMCKYLYRENDYRKSIKYKNPSYNYNFGKLCSFMINTFAECMNASRIYQSIFCDKVEFLFYDGYYEMNDSLIYWCKQYAPNKDDLYLNFAGLLYNLYTLYKFDYNYLEGRVNGVDLYLSTFLINNSDHYQWIKGSISQSLNKLVVSKKNELPRVNMESANTNMNPVSLHKVIRETTTDKYTGYLNQDIIVFGDKSVAEYFLGQSNVDKLKTDLLHLTADEIKKYVNKGENVKIEFTIPEQFKSYLQLELKCKMIVANLKKGNEIQQNTILDYEGEKFVLFISEDEPDKLYGVSLIENQDTNERKIFTMNKDEEVSYNILFNEIEE